MVAYDRLTGEGFLTSRVGAGTFVGADVAMTPPGAATRPASASSRAAGAAKLVVSSAAA